MSEKFPKKFNSVSPLKYQVYIQLLFIIRKHCNKYYLKESRMKAFIRKCALLYKNASKHNSLYIKM